MPLWRIGLKNAAKPLSRYMYRSFAARLHPQVASLAVWRFGIFSEFNNKRKITLKLAALIKQLRQRFDQQVEDIGISSARWTLIAAVAHNPGATQRMIADMLEVTEVTAGRMIDRLCADGYLRRTPHPQDRRAYCVELTESARPLLESLDDIASANENELFKGFSPNEITQLETLLDLALSNTSDAKRRLGENIELSKSVICDSRPEPEIDVLISSDAEK